MVYIVVILVVLVADLIIKAKILEIPEAGFPIEKFKGKVKIVRTFNEGMAANVLDEDPAKVKKISSLVLVIFLILSLPLFFSKKGRINRKLGAALIIGGAFSNVADRCIRGKVVDYIQFNMDKSDRMERMTYNIADFSIFIGTVLYMINSDSKKSKKNNKK